MKAINSKAKDLTYIAIGICTIIVGGFVIIQVSSFMPIPGTKYIIMAPFLSAVIYIVMSKVYTKYTLLKLGTGFGFIMMIINIFMGVAILLTTLSTQLSILAIKDLDRRAQIGAVLFAGFTGVWSLIISKYLIGGVFKEIPNHWLVYTWILCLGFGVLGTLVAKKLLKHINVYSK